MDRLHDDGNTHPSNVNVDGVATDGNNRAVMRRIKANQDENISLRINCTHDSHDRCDGNCLDYVPEGVCDMEWLGYFVGENSYLAALTIRHFTQPLELSVKDVMGPFLRGVSNNKSMQALHFTQAPLLGGEIFTMMDQFFKNNYQLAYITINNSDFGINGARLLASALTSCATKTLKSIELTNNNIAGEGVADIVKSLSKQTHLQRLDLGGTHLGHNNKSCVALANLLQSSAKKMRRLSLGNTGIGDEGIETLVPALKQCIDLKRLFLDRNSSITTLGWESIASVFEVPTHPLKFLSVCENNIDNTAMAAFARFLSKNHTLRHLRMLGRSQFYPEDRDGPYQKLDVVCQDAFSKLLCDTSSVTSTYLSNHTLENFGRMAGIQLEILEPLLWLNGRRDKTEVATIKILQNHHDFDMQPFFEWEFKVLPLVLGWLERASKYEMPAIGAPWPSGKWDADGVLVVSSHFEPNIERRKLSTTYQFVRGMPLLYVEARLRKELEDIKVEESQMDGDLAKRKEWLRERKISIMRKLGQKVNIQSELEQQAHEETIEMNTEIKRLRQQREALMNDIELLKTNKRQKCSMCMHCRHPDPHD